MENAPNVPAAERKSVKFRRMLWNFRVQATVVVVVASIVSTSMAFRQDDIFTPSNGESDSVEMQVLYGATVVLALAIGFVTMGIADSALSSARRRMVLDVGLFSLMTFILAACSGRGLLVMYSVWPPVDDYSSDARLRVPIGWCLWSGFGYWWVVLGGV